MLSCRRWCLHFNSTLFRRLGSVSILILCYVIKYRNVLRWVNGGIADTNNQSANDSFHHQFIYISDWSIICLVQWFVLVSFCFVQLNSPKPKYIDDFNNQELFQLEKEPKNEKIIGIKCIEDGLKWIYSLEWSGQTQQKGMVYRILMNSGIVALYLN